MSADPSTIDGVVVEVQFKKIETFTLNHPYIKGSKAKYEVKPLSRLQGRNSPALTLLRIRRAATTVVEAGIQGIYFEFSFNLSIYPHLQTPQRNLEIVPSALPSQPVDIPACENCAGQASHAGGRCPAR